MYIRLSDKIIPNVDQEDEDSIKLSTDWSLHNLYPKTGWGVVIPKYFTSSKEDTIYVCIELLKSKRVVDSPEYLMVPIQGDVRITKTISKGYFLKLHGVYNQKE